VGVERRIVLIDSTPILTFPLPGGRDRSRWWRRGLPPARPTPYAAPWPPGNGWAALSRRPPRSSIRASMRGKPAPPAPAGGRAVREGEGRARPGRDRGSGRGAGLYGLREGSRQQGGLAERNPPFEIRRHHRKAGYGAHDTYRFGSVFWARRLTRLATKRIRRYTHRVQVFGMPWQGRRRFSIAHPSIPSRWEGKKYPLSNDLFPLPTGGGTGVGDPIQTLPLFQHRYLYAGIDGFESG
jgi:hypothetical protein